MCFTNTFTSLNHLRPMRHSQLRDRVPLALKLPFMLQCYMRESTLGRLRRKVHGVWYC